MTDQAYPIPGWEHFYSGKVRDLYQPALSTQTGSIPAVPGASVAVHHAQASSEILVVASNRVSAFDYVLEPAIPKKGDMLTSLSRWWFDQLSEFPNHLVDDIDLRLEGIPSAVRERAMIVKRLDMFPIEAVVRGYITGSGFAEYQQTGMICGVTLPDGLRDGDKLPEPIYTPAWKAPLGEHDENITFDRSAEIVGQEWAEKIRDTALAIFHRATELVEPHGLILADTKFEFGHNTQTGELTLADEVLTSDSSRYWDRTAWETDRSMKSFDKQIVRDWLKQHWDGQGLPPELPASVVHQTAEKYRELFHKLAK